jgi:hypothetical protein
MTDERKAFEAAWSSLDWGEVYLATSENGNQLDADKIAAWLIWQARAALSAPPREPTEAMTTAQQRNSPHTRSQLARITSRSCDTRPLCARA